MSDFHPIEPDPASLETTYSSQFGVRVDQTGKSKSGQSANDNIPAIHLVLDAPFKLSAKPLPSKLASDWSRSRSRIGYARSRLHHTATATATPEIVASSRSPRIQSTMAMEMGKTTRS